VTVQPVQLEFDTRHAAFVLTPPTPQSSLLWLKANSDNIGFFRVFYRDLSVSDALFTALNPAAVPASRHLFSTNDRLGIQSDVASLVSLSEGQLVSLPSFLEKVVDAYSMEENYLVWSDLLTSIGGNMGVFNEGLACAGQRGLYPPELVTRVQRNRTAWYWRLYLPKATALGAPTGKEDDDAVVEAMTKEQREQAERDEQLQRLLYNSLLGCGHEPTLRLFGEMFDTTILPAVDEAHYQHVKKLWVPVEGAPAPAPESAEEKEAKEKALLDADNKLAAALLSLPRSFRALALSAAASMESLVPQAERPTEIPPAAPTLAEMSITDRRRVALLSVYHCRSPAALPGDTRSCLRGIFGGVSLGSFKFALRVIMEDDCSVGIMMQDMHASPAHLSRRSNVCGAQRLLEWLLANDGAHFNQLENRMKDMILHFFVDYSTRNVISFDQNPDGAPTLLAQAREFFLKRQSLFPPRFPMQSLEAIERNTSYWAHHSAAVVEWLASLDKS
jgi:hypothetical protein